MKKSHWKTSVWKAAVAAACLVPAGAWASMVDFGDLSLAAESFYNGADEAGGFTSGGVFFPNDYNSMWDVWSGFAYSNRTTSEVSAVDVSSGNFLPYQYETRAGGAFAGENFAVAFIGGSLRLDLPVERQVPQSMAVTNVLYAWASMTYGDSFAKQFTGADEDYLRLTIRGLDASEASLGEVDVWLADFRAADAGEHFILDEWLVVDLTTLGGGVHSLEFSMDSSDVGDFGVNTPTYFAMDGLVAIPEPRLAALAVGLAVLGGAMALRRRKA
ncbi:MAG: DUF4465 domain-containing protein [Opitutales bacterium]|nr:DUF4465 domain-containing protein [Opitutales bacterium]